MQRKAKSRRQFFEFVVGKGVDIRKLPYIQQIWSKLTSSYRISSDENFVGFPPNFLSYLSEELGLDVVDLELRSNSFFCHWGSAEVSVFVQRKAAERKLAIGAQAGCSAGELQELLAAANAGMRLAIDRHKAALLADPGRASREREADAQRAERVAREAREAEAWFVPLCLAASLNDPSLQVAGAH